MQGDLCDVLRSEWQGKRRDFQHAVEIGAEEQLLEQPLGKFPGVFTSIPAYVQLR